MFRCVRGEGLVMLWHTESAMGWMVCWKQSIEETVEFAFTHVTDVAHFYRAV